MKNLVPYLLMVVYKAGKVILDIYSKGFDVTYKNDLSPLTIADKRSNEIIISLLSAQALSQFPILSEESKSISYDERKEWEYFWLVDPLDGTKEFIKRNGEFTVNIALVHKYRPVLGIIYIPVKDTLYFAAEGIGAYKLQSNEVVELLNKESTGKGADELLNEIINRSIKLTLDYSTTRTLNHITIIGSRSHATNEQQEFIEDIKKKCNEIEFISAGSSLKFCLVAEGKADIYPRFGPTMEWDTAAGQAIVEQAGGKVLNTQTKEPLRYNKENLLNPWFIVGKDELLRTMLTI